MQSNNACQTNHAIYYLGVSMPFNDWQIDVALHNLVQHTAGFGRKNKLFSSESFVIQNSHIDLRSVTEWSNHTCLVHLKPNRNSIQDFMFKILPQCLQLSQDLRCINTL